MAVPNFEGNIIFALFSCPSIFDETPLHIKERDCLAGEAFNIFLETEIVRKLRCRDLALEEGSGRVIADFRQVSLIRHVEDSKGFINTLFKEALRLPSFLEYSNNNSAKPLYMHTLTLPRIQQHDFEVRTIQYLLDLNIQSNNINPLKFKFVPSPALIIQLPRDRNDWICNGYSKVTPSLEIDLAKLVDGGGTHCSDTGYKLDLVSILCSTQGQLTTLVRCGHQGEDWFYLESSSLKIHTIPGGSKILRDAASPSRSQSRRDFIDPKFRCFFSDALLYIYAPRPPRTTLYYKLKNGVRNAVCFATCYMAPSISKQEEMNIPSTTYERNERPNQSYVDTSSAEEGIKIDHSRIATRSTFADSVNSGAVTTSDIPVVPIPIRPGLRKSFPYVTHGSVPDVCGKKGIKLLQNSCYVDTALVSFFFCTDILDDLVFLIKTTDGELTREIKVDIVDIVNELRSTKFVGGEQVMRFRQKLIQRGNFTPKLSGEFMDAEEFLFILFKKVLQLLPFIHYANGASDFLHQIFLPASQLNKEVTSVQELFDQSMRYNGNLKLTERPNPALIILLPRSNGKLMGRLECILPSLTLDLTSAMQGRLLAGRKCIRCKAIAKYACSVCIQDEDNNMMVSCASEECLEIEKRRHQGLQHNPKLITIHPPNPDETRMKLIGVVCVATFHYTSFVRCGDEWLYYDSMVPSITTIEDGNDILDENEQNYNAGELDSIYWPDGNMRRIFEDCYYCIYVPAPAEAVRYRDESVCKQEEMDITPCVSRHEKNEPIMQQNYLETQSAEEGSRTKIAQTATESCNRGMDIVNPEAVANMEWEEINSGRGNFDRNTFGGTTSDDSTLLRGLQQSQTMVGASHNLHSSLSVTTATDFNPTAKVHPLPFPSPHVQQRDNSSSALQYDTVAGCNHPPQNILPVTDIQSGTHENEIRSPAQEQRTYSQVAAERPSHRQSFLSNDVPVIPPGLRKPCPHFAQRDVQDACGTKGIQIFEHSSYIDTALFSFFFCTDNLDDLVFHIKDADEPLTREIKVDIFDIVNKLRSKLFVEGDQVMRFREKLMQRGNFTSKLSGASMDAEEFLFILFKKALHLPPFIHYATGASDFLHQIFLPISQITMEVATVQELFDQSMRYNGNLKLTKRPNPALIILLPRSNGKLMGRLQCILPSLTLDLTSVMQQDGRKCFQCNSNAARACLECARVKNNLMVCCTRPECKKTVETLHQTIAHDPKFINIDPPNPDENRMKLIGVVCVADKHNTAFVRCEDEWLSFDSVGPKITQIEGGTKALIKYERNHNAGNRISKEKMGRIFKDCYYCIYGPFVQDNSTAME